MATAPDRTAPGIRHAPSVRRRALLALVVAAVLTPMAAVAAMATTASPALAAGPAPIPGGLWNAFPGVVGDYAVVDGEPGDPITGGVDSLYSGPEAVVAVRYESGQLAGVIHARGPGYVIALEGPGGALLTERGYYPDGTATPAGPEHVGIDVSMFNGQQVRCSGPIAGWVAIDHLRLLNGQIGELDLRLEQSCNGNPPLHVKIHFDHVDESVYGPDPVPSGLWDSTPLGVGDQDYVFVEGAEGDPQTSGADSFLIGDGFEFRDISTDLGTFLRIGDEGWIGSFTNYRSRAVVEPGYYPVYTDVRVTPLEPPFLTWQKLGVSRCTTTDGWFAVDDIVRLGGQIVKLDLRLEQSCDGKPPLHAKIHLDRVPPPTTTTSTTVPPTTTSTTAPPSTTTRPSTTTTRPPTTTTTTTPPPPPPPPVLSRTPGPPFGSLDVASPSVGSVQVAGWVIDPDTTAPIPVHVYVDGVGTALTANGTRPDVAAAFAGYGPSHGFSASIPASGGSHQVCVYGINVGVGANSLIGCREVTVPSGAPFGALDVATSEPGSIQTAGWAIDPDTAASIPVHVYVDGVGTATTADGVRPDVGAAFPGYGSAHGFGLQTLTGAGDHTVCAYAINAGPGDNSLIGCRQVTVPGGSPFGALDVAAPVAGGLRVAGWAIDPDTAASIDVHVYVDGSGKATTASGRRDDVAAALAGYGSAHGYDVTVPASAGAHQVCTYGINVATGSNSLLGCRTVAVP